MKLTILLITALAGISVAAPAEVPASSNVEVKARQHTQPGPCDWCDTHYNNCMHGGGDKGSCRNDTCHTQRGQCKRCGYCS